LAPCGWIVYQSQFSKSASQIVETQTVTQIDESEVYMFDKLKKIGEKAKNAISSTTVLVGDLNGDGKVDAEDARIAAEWAKNKSASIGLDVSKLGREPRRSDLAMLPSDQLTIRLNILNQNDLKTILVSGLKIDEEIVYGKNKDALIRLFSKELRSAGSSTTAGLLRTDHEFPYKQILIDVVDKLTPGHTPLSWTKYKLEDSHSEVEIEEKIAVLFEDKARAWWNSLSDEKKSKFANDIDDALKKQDVASISNGGMKSFIGQQAIENVIQAGIMKGAASMAASGVMGGVGISIIGQIGWIVLLQTVGWMGGLKIAIFGVAGHGALGGAVTAVGSAAIGAAMSVPTLFALADGAAYRKTVPTAIMLIARLRAPAMKAKENN
jgi:uncharacterized protein YaaW (UPF0174 family)